MTPPLLRTMTCATLLVGCGSSVAASEPVASEPVASEPATEEPASLASAAPVASADEAASDAACTPGDVLNRPALPPTGTSRQMVLYVDFPDAPAQGPVGDAAAPFDLLDGGYPASQDRLDVQVDHHDQWLRMPAPSGDWGIEPGFGFAPHQRYIQQAVDLADPSVDFSDYESVQVVPSDGSDGVTVSAQLRGPVFSDEGALPVSVSYDDRALDARPSVVVHETGHLFGQKDLYAYGGVGGVHRHVGGFDIMGLTGGPAPTTFGIHRRALGWLDPSDVACVTAEGSSTVDLRPVGADDGTRLAVVPTGSYGGVALEYRTATGLDDELCREGLVVSTFDPRTPGGEGPVRVVDPTAADATRDQCIEPVDDAALQSGQTLSVPGTGVTVSVADADADVASVVVERATPATARVVRLAGSDRLETAAAASRATFDADAAQAVVLARSDDFADALTGTPLAVANDGPVLLTRRGGLDRVVTSELDRVLPDGGSVLLLGGTAAISPDVEDDLEAAGYDVERIAGSDRFETAVRVAEEFGSPGDVLLASGSDFPDALAAGAAAARTDAAVLLTDDDRRVEATNRYLAAHPEGRRWAIGGPAATAHPTAEPLVGTDRFDTAVQVAETLLPEASVVAVSTADDFPDALAAGATVGADAGPVLLAGRDAVPEVLRSHLCDRRDDTAAVVLTGGPAAITEATSDQLAAALDGSACP